jgi:hypothetical protein
MSLSILIRKEHFKHLARFILACTLLKSKHDHGWSKFEQKNFRSFRMKQFIKNKFLIYSLVTFSLSTILYVKAMGGEVPKLPGTNPGRVPPAPPKVPEPILVSNNA